METNRNSLKTDNSKIVITLDGPAGSGKSTLARLLAKELKFYHLDSGAIYRAYTYAVIQKLGPGSDAEDFGRKFSMHFLHPSSFSIEVKFIDKLQCIYYNGKLLNQELRTPELTRRIKFIADHIEYRKYVNEMIRKLAKQYPLVVDGRDMGTEVFPDAKYKFYLDANVEVRAQRRWEELSEEQRQKITLENIKKEIIKRDEQDKNRKTGALRIPENAIIIDTSNLTRNMVLNILLSNLQIKF